jgi:hypothetical protein
VLTAGLILGGLGLLAAAAVSLASTLHGNIAGPWAALALFKKAAVMLTVAHAKVTSIGLSSGAAVAGVAAVAGGAKMATTSLLFGKSTESAESPPPSTAASSLTSPGRRSFPPERSPSTPG